MECDISNKFKILNFKNSSVWFHFQFRVKSCGARVLSMDQLEGIKPFHENWGEIKLGEELDEVGT